MYRLQFNLHSVVDCIQHDVVLDDHLATVDNIYVFLLATLLVCRTHDEVQLDSYMLPIIFDQNITLHALQLLRSTTQELLEMHILTLLFWNLEKRRRLKLWVCPCLINRRKPPRFEKAAQSA